MFPQITEVSVSWRVRLRFLPTLFRIVAGFMLILSLSEIQVGSAQTIEISGIDMVICLDISSSMGTNDISGQTRLEAAKRVIDTFVNRRTNDQIGLVLFAQEAYHILPPTRNTPVFLSYLRHVALSTVLQLNDGTAMGIGLASAGNMLRSSQSTSRVVILLTDGVNNAGALIPGSYPHRASVALSIRVYTIGLGKRQPIRK